MIQLGPRIARITQMDKRFPGRTLGKPAYAASGGQGLASVKSVTSCCWF